MPRWTVKALVDGEEFDLVGNEAWSAIHAKQIADRLLRECYPGAYIQVLEAEPIQGDRHAAE